MRQNKKNYRYDWEKQEGCGLVAPERLTEQRVTIEWLLPKRNSLPDLCAFLGPNGSILTLSLSNHSYVFEQR